MQNHPPTISLTLSKDEYRNLRVFLKSINMVRLSQNFDTDDLGMAIAQTTQTIAAAEDENADNITIEMTEDIRRNLDIFLQNLNLTRLSANTDTVTLSLAIVQVAQTIVRAGQEAAGNVPVSQVEETPVRTEKTTKKSKAPSNVTPLRNEASDDRSE